MVSKMTGLEKTTLKICSRGSLPLEMRHMSRYSMSLHPILCISSADHRPLCLDLARAVSAATLTLSMDHLSIEFNPAGPDDHGSSPNLISPGSTVDLLNPALHGLMAKVGKLSLDRYVVTPGLFWPSPSDIMWISLPLWENLREVYVLMSMSAPDGGRYLVVDVSSNRKSCDDDGKYGWEI